MRAIFKTGYELTKEGFCWDEDGGIRKDSYYLDRFDCDELLGNLYEVSRYENERVLVKFYTYEQWFPLIFVKSELDLKYYPLLKDLGIRLEVPFRIKEYSYRLYTITLEGMFEYSDDYPYDAISLGHDTSVIDGIISGKYTLITDKWKPSEGDWYYTWSGKKAYKQQWIDGINCHYDYLTFNCFPTEIMAKVYGSKLLDEYYASLKVDFENADSLDEFGYEVQKERLRRRIGRLVCPHIPQGVNEALAEEDEKV